MKEKDGFLVVPRKKSSDSSLFGALMAFQYGRSREEAEAGFSKMAELAQKKKRQAKARPV